MSSRWFSLPWEAPISWGRKRKQREPYSLYRTRFPAEDPETDVDPGINLLQFNSPEAGGRHQWMGLLG